MPCFTPVRSQESNGLSKAFVRTFKGDYLRNNPLPDAATALQQIAGWIDDDNEVHPHSALRMRPPGSSSEVRPHSRRVRSDGWHSRAELQQSQASAAELVRRYGLNEKTVTNWRSRQCVEDQPMGPKERHRSVLSAIERSPPWRCGCSPPSTGRRLRRPEGCLPHLTHPSLRRSFKGTGSPACPGRPREAQALQALRDRPLPHQHRRVARRRR